MNCLNQGAFGRSGDSILTGLLEKHEIFRKCVKISFAQSKKV